MSRKRDSFTPISNHRQLMFFFSQALHKKNGEGWARDLGFAPDSRRFISFRIFFVYLDYWRRILVYLYRINRLRGGVWVKLLNMKKVLKKKIAFETWPDPSGIGGQSERAIKFFSSFAHNRKNRVQGHHHCGQRRQYLCVCDWARFFGVHTKSSLIWNPKMTHKQSASRNAIEAILVIVWNG